MIKVKIVNKPKLKLPQYPTPGPSGADFGPLDDTERGDGGFGHSGRN